MNKQRKQRIVEKVARDIIGQLRAVKSHEAVNNEDTQDQIKRLSFAITRLGRGELGTGGDILKQLKRDWSSVPEYKKAVNHLAAGIALLDRGINTPSEWQAVRHKLLLAQKAMTRAAVRSMRGKMPKSVY